MTGIYCITNLINNKKYIGQSANIESRWKEHKLKPFRKCTDKNKCLYRAIRKYGLDNFKFEVIEECSPEELNEREIYWIKFYQTFPPELGKGYNENEGGDSGKFNKLKENEIKEIINLLKNTSITQKEIANIFKVHHQTINDINVGKAYFNKDISYPIRETKNRKISILDIKTIEEIQNLLIFSYIPKYKIASRFNIRKEIVDDIDKGKRNYNSKLKYPLRCKKDKVSYHMEKPKLPIPPYEELLKSFYELRSAAKVAEKYNISQVLLKKWCNKVGINPQHKNEYIERYEVEFLGKKPKIKRPLLKILQIDPNTNKIVNIFDSFADAAKKLTLSKSTIKSTCDKNKIYAGYIWKRSNEMGIKSHK